VGFELTIFRLLGDVS